MGADDRRFRDLRKLLRDIAPIGLACVVLVLILIVSMVVVMGVWFGAFGA